MVCYINIQQNSDYIYIYIDLGLVTSLESPIFGELLRKRCINGKPGLCCIEAGCSPNCDQDCQDDGYIRGGQCNKIGHGIYCCCNKYS
jgi:hypothetical protein